jgi:hypothetical protein
MALTDANYAHSGSLTAATVTALSIAGWEFGVWIQNRDATAEIWARFDGTDPTVAGDGCYLISPGAHNFPTGPGLINVRMISSGTPAYTVSGAVRATVSTA